MQNKRRFVQVGIYLPDFLHRPSDGTDEDFWAEHCQQLSGVRRGAIEAERDQSRKEKGKG
jgi:hypothetical protein